MMAVSVVLLLDVGDHAHVAVADGALAVLSHVDKLVCFDAQCLLRSSKQEKRLREGKTQKEKSFF